MENFFGLRMLVPTTNYFRALNFQEFEMLIISKMQKQRIPETRR